MEELTHLLENPEGKIIGTALVLLVLSLLRYLANRLINKRVAKLHDRYLWRQMVSYLISITALLLIIRLWFEWFQSILTLLSLVAAALVIVSKELIINGLSYGIILWRQLFDVGDRIQIGTHMGDVIETGPFYFSIAEIGNWVSADDATGRVVKVPNGLILTQPLANYTRGASLIWNELTLDLTIASNWQRAKALAEEAARAHTYEFKPGEIEGIQTAREEIIFVDPTSKVFLGLRDGKLALTTRYVCKLHKRRTTEQALLEDLLQRFAEADDIHLVGKT